MSILNRNRFLCLYISIFFVISSFELSSQPFEFYGQEQPLRDVLTAIGTHSGLGIKINDDIEANFSGHLKQSNSIDALNYLAASFDLVWYNDGATLFVDPIHAMKSQLFQLNQITARDVMQTMQALSIWDSRFEWRSLHNKAILMVSGPPRYLELVDKTIEILNGQVKIAENDLLSIKIFPLNYASAIDRRVSIREEEILVPGVATLLQGLLTESNALSEHEKNTHEQTYLDEKDNEKDNPTENNITKTQGIKAQNYHKRMRGTPHPQAAIYPDPSSNSIIIQDYESRIALYQKIIEQLDVEKDQLEISLIIIDLTANSLLDIGIDWSIARREEGGGLIDLILPGTTEQSTSTLIGSNADFLARITALESQGRAKVTSRPAVVTENGVEASLDNNETFFVRLQGERVADLEQITYGTLLQVVPRIVNVNQNTQPMIHLDVKIEDANRLLDGGVDSLPSIRNTEITTRSVVPNGGSLLIGGYYREATTSNQDGIPLLNKIPVLGKFFSYQGDSHSQLVRIFMLSSRILPSNKLQQANLLFNEENSQYPVNHTEQIRLLSDLSNYNPAIKTLKNEQKCRSAFKARVQRNDYLKNNISARIIPCTKIGPETTYRVIIL